MTKLHLNPIYLATIKGILKKHLKKRKVVAFGSRVTGNFKPHSDLDLCIMGDDSLSIQEIAALKEDFSESQLPIRIDIVVWTDISSEFQEIIKNNKFELQ